MRPCPAPEMKTKASFYLILAASVPLLLTLIAGKARGQSALDGFDPQASSTVHSIAVQRDGKILLGGVFNQILGVPRNGIARINLDGTLDDTFNANIDDQSYIIAMAIQADGKILASGNFRDASLGYMARLDPVTGAADSFNSTGGQPPFGDYHSAGRQDPGRRIFYDHWWNKRAISSRGSTRLLALLIPSMRISARAEAATLMPSPCSQTARCLSVDISPRWEDSHVKAWSG